MIKSSAREKVLPFGRERLGSTYAQKKVRLIQVVEEGHAVAVTVYVFPLWQDSCRVSRRGWGWRGSPSGSLRSPPGEPLATDPQTPRCATH